MEQWCAASTRRSRESPAGSGCLGEWSRSSSWQIIRRTTYANDRGKASWKFVRYCARDIEGRRRLFYRKRQQTCCFTGVEMPIHESLLLRQLTSIVFVMATSVKHGPNRRSMVSRCDFL